MNNIHVKIAKFNHILNIRYRNYSSLEVKRVSFNVGKPCGNRQDIRSSMNVCKICLYEFSTCE